MNPDYLLKRRADVIARHEVLESVQGSGYHPDDGQAQDMARRKLLPLSKRPTAIHNDGTTYLCGPDVPFVRESLRGWLEGFRKQQKEHQDAAAAAGIEPSSPSPQAKQAERVAAAVANGDSEVIQLGNAEWNSVLYGLNELNIHVVTAGALP